MRNLMIRTITRDAAPASFLSNGPALLRRQPRGFGALGLTALAILLAAVSPTQAWAQPVPGKDCSACAPCDPCDTLCRDSDGRTNACGSYACRRLPSCSLCGNPMPAGTPCSADNSQCTPAVCGAGITCGTGGSGDVLAGAAGAIHYLHADPLGSTRMGTAGDEWASANARYDYLPFGEEIPPDVNGRGTPGSGYFHQIFDSSHKFTGKERDAESQLDYFGARYYSAAMGRFTSADAPFADQHAGDPQSWHLYSYVRNQPLSLVDPDGQQSLDAVAYAPRYVFDATRNLFRYGAFKTTPQLQSESLATYVVIVRDHANPPRPGAAQRPYNGLAQRYTGYWHRRYGQIGDLAAIGPAFPMRTTPTGANGAPTLAGEYTWVPHNHQASALAVPMPTVQLRVRAASPSPVLPTAAPNGNLGNQQIQTSINVHTANPGNLATRWTQDALGAASSAGCHVAMATQARPPITWMRALALEPGIAWTERHYYLQTTANQLQP